MSSSVQMKLSYHQRLKNVSVPALSSHFAANKKIFGNLALSEFPLACVSGARELVRSRVEFNSRLRRSRIPSRASAV